MLMEEAGRIGICSDFFFFFGGPEPHLIRYIKEGHCGETPRSLFFRDAGGWGKTCMPFDDISTT